MQRKEPAAVPLTVQAAILVEQMQPLVVDRITLPDELSHGQVRVCLTYSGICGSQLGEIAGVKGPDRFLPHLLGHEGVGRIAETGPGVTTVQPGDRVVLHWRPGSGLTCQPPRYDWNGQTVNAGWVTTFNDAAVVAENRVTAIPDGLADKLAPLLGCAVTTGLGVINNDAGVRIGESVVVIGSGGVGLNIVQGAALASAYPIVAVDLHDNRLALAKRLGATHTINVDKRDLRKTLMELAPPWGWDIIIDNTGQPNQIELAYDLTHSTGRVILVGVPAAGEDARFYTLPLHFGKSITGSHGGDAKPARDIPRYLTLHKEGRLQLDDLITREYPLERINDAIDDMRSGALAGRCLIRLDDAN